VPYHIRAGWFGGFVAAISVSVIAGACLPASFGNSRSGLGNVVHVDLAFPLNVAPGIQKVQFLVQTEQTF